MPLPAHLFPGEYKDLDSPKPLHKHSNNHRSYPIFPTDMANSNGIVSGMNAFITGAGSGIGRAAALAYAKAGATGLAISDVNDASVAETVALIAKQSPHVDVLALHLDTTSEQGVKEAIEQSVAKFRRIDVAMNIAGIAHGGLTHECDFQAWKKVMDVNIDGVWMCQKEELKMMLKQEDKGYRVGRGVIINISSLLGLLGGPSSPYTASKHGRSQPPLILRENY